MIEGSVNSKIKDLSLLSLIALSSTLLVWLPHLLSLDSFWGLSFSNGFDIILRNFDGLEYITIAKSFYDHNIISTIPYAHDANYYPAHFPGYPLLIATFAPIIGFLKSMLFVSITSTILAVWMFYLLVSDFKLTQSPLFLSILFLFLPARWLIVRSVGSPEPLFIFFILVAFYSLLKFIKFNSRIWIWISAIFAALAQLTRPPGNLYAFAVFLFVLFQSYMIFKDQDFKKSITYLLSFYPYLLVPLTLTGIFYFYQVITGDFWAYFHSGDNIHLFFPPFSIFNQNQTWVGTIWLEDAIYVLLLGYLGGFLLLKQKLYPLAFFVLTYVIAASFVAHKDLSRYTLPVAPLVLIAFEKVLVSKEFKIVFAVLLLAIYLYSQNFLLQNTAPVPQLHLYYN